MKKVLKVVGILLVILLILSFDFVWANNEGYLVKFCDGFYPDINKYNLSKIYSEKGIYKTDNIGSLEQIESFIEYISQNDEVSLIEGREAVMPFSLPEDELYSEQWQMQMINAETGWKMETYGNNIRVAVIDSGCVLHDDLKNNLLEGKNYLNGTTDVTDNIGHGTHVSGIIAAEMNDYGVVGVAPKAKIVPLKCFDPNYETYVEDILNAIYDAVDIYNCKVINMSWGVKGDNPFLKEAIDYATNKGAILIAAVGNYSSTTLYYPAAYSSVIGVSSVGMNKTKSSFAQYNRSVMITAAGEKVKSTYKNGSYQMMQGTSQSAPMVSGVAAVALSMNENLTCEQFKELLISTAEDLGDEGYDEKFGYGLVNEDALVRELLKETPFYVSPINLKDESAYVLIKNNTTEILKASSMFLKYDKNKFVGFEKTPITLLPNKEILLKIKNSNKRISHLLWSDINSLVPLCAKREMK